MFKRPILNIKIDPNLFKMFYWTKKELIVFCVANNIPSQGCKIEVTERIELFLRTGQINKPQKIIKKRIFDSHNILTLNTLVINYKNDSKTRQFFKEHIGPNFRFNSYLRQFTNISNIENNLTYGDLVNGWIKEENNKKDPKYKSTINKQFKYNQFQRDFYANEKGKSHKQLIEAWKFVRSAPGETNYKHYLDLISKKK